MNRVAPGSIVRPVKDDLNTYSEPRLSVDTTQRYLSASSIIMVIGRLPEVKGRSMGENGTWLLVMVDDTLGWVPIVWIEEWWATEGYKDVSSQTSHDLYSTVLRAT